MSVRDVCLSFSYKDKSLKKCQKLHNNDKKKNKDNEVNDMQLQAWQKALSFGIIIARVPE